MESTVRAADIVKNDTTPPTWSVEMIDDDGGVDVTVFSGPDADQRAIEYARWKYRYLDSYSGASGTPLCPRL